MARTTEADRKRRMKKFLRHFARVGTIYHACKKAGINRTVVHHWMRVYPEFREKLIAAKEASIERLETSVYQKAVSGKSDLLAIFLLKSMRPAVYRDNYKQNDTDEQELNAAIERQLARMAGTVPPTLPPTVDGTVVDSTTSSPTSEGIPESDV